MKYKTFENILTKKEADEIIAWTKGKVPGKCGVMTTNLAALLGSSTTSNTSNDQYPIQKQHFTGAMVRISEWLSEITGYPSSQQQWSILHYKKGQMYPQHHDGSSRFYTCYIYLNDVDGGETTFPNANVELHGEVGRGMLWQNYTLSSFFGIPCLKKDPSTEHYAKPTKRGEKWGLQIFIKDKTYLDEQSICNIVVLIIIIVVFLRIIQLSIE